MEINKSQEKEIFGTHRKRSLNECFLKNTPLIMDIIKIITTYDCDEPEIKEHFDTIGTRGTGKLKFTTPRGIVTDGKYIYVNDSGNCRVQVMTTNGKFVTCWGKAGYGDGEFCWLGFSAIYRSNIYVADRDNRRIQVFSIPEGKFVRKFSCNYICWGICVSGSYIYVSFENEYIGVYTLEGILVKEFVCDKIYVYGAKNLCVVNDEIYMINFALTSIFCFSISGEFKFSIDPVSKGGRRLLSPYSIIITDKSLYVGDKIGIQQFDRNNNFLLVKKINGKEDYNIGGMTFIDNMCFTTDCTNDIVRVFK